jgi:hypothetical protein
MRKKKTSKVSQSPKSLPDPSSPQTESTERTDMHPYHKNLHHSPPLDKHHNKRLHEAHFPRRKF